ncbi:hypothetical protein LTR78_004803 [Recurvomyces mirabilis]|uniref:Myb-like domain-containing protein n=1 Tax=Recurvomyces mirabilis TaxID=574656 RepID=A0AAE0WP70_9PEZI|nr:hypothetical protein LTR78_004803 [Recurvomyces mirabilis]KAK5157975.1 hypothetical protein LTS14_003898 [Recurvomyces mirabilis]
MDPDHSFFADETYHLRDEHDVAKDLFHQPLAYQAAPNFAFRPLLGIGLGSASGATSAEQPQGLHLSIPGAPLVRADSVDSKQYTPISECDWASAELDSDATSPASATYSADSPATPEFGDHDGGFTNHYFRSGSHINNGLALAWAKSQGRAFGNLTSQLSEARELTPMFEMPQPLSNIGGGHYSHGRSLPADVAICWPIDHGRHRFNVACDNYVPVTAHSSAPSPGQSSCFIHEDVQSSSNSSSSRKDSTSLSEHGSQKRISINSSVYAIQERDAKLGAGKAKGWSYKKIKQHYKLKDAESTLRGRWRTLTKKSEQRVRKPSWEPIDDQLLVEGYDYYTNGGSTKIPWKKIGAYIKDSGGLYHFGGATCAKRYRELDEAGRV